MTGTEIAVLMIVVVGAFFVKAVTGLGGPILAIPILAPVLGFERAVVAIALPNIVSNLLLVWGNREAARAAAPLLRRMLPAGALGAVAGSLVLVSVDDRWLLGAMAVIVFAYIALALGRGEVRLSEGAAARLGGPVGLAAGVMHGATGNSGAVLGTFLHALSLPRAQFVLSAAVPFLVLSVVQVTTLVALGRVESAVAGPAAAAIVPVLAITPLGTRLGRRIPQRTFGRVVLALLAVAGLRLVGSAVGR